MRIGFIALVLIGALGGAHAAGLDLKTTLDVLAIQYELKPLVEARPDEFIFRVFVQRPLSDEQYAIEGRMRTQTASRSGTLTMHQFDRDDIRIRTFALAPSQAAEVESWFTESRIGPGSRETLDVAVLDGAQLVLEGSRGGKYFRCIRNSGDSEASGELYRKIEAFRIWTEEAPNQSPEPTR